MRKLNLFTLLALFTLVVTPVFAYDDPSISNLIKKSGVGAKQSEAVRVVKLIRYASAEANSPSLVSGDAVVYSTASDDGVTVALSTSSRDGAFAGIVVTTIPSSDASTGTSAGDDIGRRNWGWIVVHGPATAAINTAGRAITAGDVFVTSNDGTVSNVTAELGSIDALAAARTRHGGFFFDSQTTETTADVFVLAE